MDLGLRDRAYLVTGGSRGLGFAAARLGQDAAAGTAAWVVADNADPVLQAATDGIRRMTAPLAWRHARPW